VPYRPFGQLPGERPTAATQFHTDRSCLWRHNYAHPHPSSDQISPAIALLPHLPTLFTEPSPGYGYYQVLPTLGWVITATYTYIKFATTDVTACCRCGRVPDFCVSGPMMGHGTYRRRTITNATATPCLAYFTPAFRTPRLYHLQQTRVCLDYHATVPT